MLFCVNFSFLHQERRFSALFAFLVKKPITYAKFVGAHLCQSMVTEAEKASPAFTHMKTKKNQEPKTDRDGKHYKHEWERLRLGQMRRLATLLEYGPWSTHPANVSETTFNRDLKSIRDAFGVGKLVEGEGKELHLSMLGEWLASAFQPAIGFCERLSNNEIHATKDSDRCFRIGSGGSLASWLIGSRLKAMREALNEGVSYLTAEEAERSPRIQAEVLRNRVTAADVASGALDCGLVREGVIDGRLGLLSRHIGTIEYYLYIPKGLLDRALEKEMRQTERGRPLPIKLEQRILEIGPVATVGPDGECRLELDAALEDYSIRANIELQYRAFPMLVPLMMRKKHMFIMPDIQQLGGEEAEPDAQDYHKFKLAILDERYKRKIFLVVHHKYAKRATWMNFDKLCEALKF